MTDLNDKQNHGLIIPNENFENDKKYIASQITSNLNNLKKKPQQKKLTTNKNDFENNLNKNPQNTYNPSKEDSFTEGLNQKIGNTSLSLEESGSNQKTIKSFISHQDLQRTKKQK